MLAIEAHRLGYRCAIYTGEAVIPGEDPPAPSPAGQVAEVEVHGRFDDAEAVLAFCQQVDVVTFEFENVPASVGDGAARAGVVCRPPASALETAQHRGRERRFLVSHDIPVAPHAFVDDSTELNAALEVVGVPAILKTASFGYDGKGQARVERAEDAAAALASIGGGPAIAEAVVDFAYEASVIVARGADGTTATHGLIENRHHNHILDVSIAPAPSAASGTSVEADASALAVKIAEAMELVGVLGVEFFVMADGALVVNELAPRVHNSGHLSIEACVSNQFEQQVRAVVGLPLGDGRVVRAAAMANLLGEVWEAGEPAWERALAVPGVALHLYGKAEPRPGRKMGHLTAVAETPALAVDIVERARAELLGTPRSDSSPDGTPA
jgi:5-(carboxyamino)imidazole ribonucleotide synthase